MTSFLDRVDAKRKPRNGTATATPYGLKALQDECRTVAATPEGTRNDRLNTAALKIGQLVSGGQLPEDMAVDQLTEAARACGLDESEIGPTIRSGLNAGKREPRAPAANTSGACDLLAGLVTAADLDAMTFRPLIQHIPGLVTEGLGVIGGAPKVGKSWFVMDLALATAQGGLALGSVSVESRHVLLLALEDGNRRLQGRMRNLNHGKPLPPNLHVLTKVEPGRVTETIAAWIALHANDTNPPMVILDTLGKARPQRARGDDPFIADYQFAGRLKNTIDAVPGAALLVVHHTRKGADEDFLNTLSGTQGIAAAADYVLILTRKRKSDQGILAVTGRDIFEDEYALTIKDGFWQIDGADLGAAAAAAEERRDKDRLGDRALAVLKFVNSRPETRAADVAKQLGIDAKQASVYLGRLSETGQVGKRGRGVYTPVVSVGSVENP